MDRIDRLLEPGRLLGGALVEALLQERLALDEPGPGIQLGAYRIERELGRGGMGIVYLATRIDGAYRQDVAIKWLPLGGMAAAAAEQFRRERQILADLRHPHIARLLDGGSSEDGHLWFAMEHVDGMPVDRHAVEARLDWRGRVRLLLPVVEAVQHAHARLHIHRDIKPDNVLVGSDGRAVLVDFGIAALLGETDARPAFTEAYASPEQRLGAAPDIGDDIWQLGRLLQAVLDAGHPAQARPDYPQDLLAIIQRATDPQPERRYATAAALVVDLHRLLAHRPVSARRPTPWHRLRLLARAHPLGMTLGLAATLAFATTIVGFMLRLSHQRDLAEQARNTAEAINAFIEDDLLPGNDPLQAGGGDLGLADVAERALKRAESRLQHTPEVAARVQMSLGRTLAILGRFRSAERAFDNAVGLHASLHGALDARTLRARLLREQQLYDPVRMANAESRLQSLRKDILQGPGAGSDLLLEVDGGLGRAAFLADDFRTCVSRYRTLLPRLARAGPVLRSDAYMTLSMCEARLGDYPRALAHARQSHALVTAALGSQHPYTFESQMALETALVGMGRFDDAVAVLQPMVTNFTARYGSEHAVTLLAQHDLGLALVCAGQAQRAVPWLQLASRGRARLLGPKHPWHAISESVLGMALLQSGQLASAQLALGRARAAFGEQAGQAPYVQAALLENEADLALAKGDAAVAIGRFDAAMATAGKLYPAGHQRLTVLQLGRGLAMLDAGHADAARPLLREALQQLGERRDCRQYQIDDARRRLAGAID